MRTLASTLLIVMLAGCATPPALRVIDNVLSHEGATPPSPPLVRELLARPLRSLQAQAIFARSVPEPLSRLAHAPRAELEPAIERFLDELVQAQRALRDAIPSVPALEARLPPPALQREFKAQPDPAPFLEAIERFLRQRIEFPAQGAHYARGDILVILGTPGDDVHELAPLRDGAVRVLIDPGGNDRYRGPDVVLHGLAAIVDLGGDDHYQSDGPAWGSAVAGVSLLLDVAGNDIYEASDFSIGAALGGLGAVLDLAGDDTYRVRAFGQGLGLAHGTGILWDRSGNDRYRADGLPDPFERGGGLSFAQGAAVGVRTGMGGGIGILRDDAGDDAYEAQLFAQGVGYYYALGLLWDRSGNDRYRAARYAQGAGVHQAVGVLRDEFGNDSYELTVGVGQGIGVDLAVGVLVDASGDDSYRAPTLAQGAATDNGVGIVKDGGGADEWRLEHLPGRGNAEWSRGLPSVGLVLADAPAMTMPVARATGETGRKCPAETGAAPADVPLTDALRALGPELANGRVDAARYALVMRELRLSPEQSLDALPLADFDVRWPLDMVLGCALTGANDGDAERMLNAFARLLEEPRFASLVASALRARPGVSRARSQLIQRLMAHPSCGIRTEALSLEGSVQAAQAALQDSCWQLQARALWILDGHGVRPEDTRLVPNFLFHAPQASGKRSESSRAP